MARPPSNLIYSYTRHMPPTNEQRELQYYGRKSRLDGRADGGHMEHQMEQ